jgi:hypothetical protein
VGGQTPFDGVAAQPPAGAGWEQRVLRVAGPLVQPGGEHRLCRGGERHRAVLSALALAAHVRAGGERDVGAAQRDELGDPQAGLERQREHRPVAPALPARRVGRRDQGAGLLRGEERDRALVEALGRDREHACDHRGVLGMPERGVFEKRPDRRQPEVARPGAVAPLDFEVLKERRDQPLVEVVPVKRGGCLAGLLLREAEQQPQRVAIGGDRRQACLQLACQPVGEERLQRRGDLGHDRTA